MKSTHSRAALGVVVAAVAIGGVGSSAASAEASVIKASDTAHLRYVSASGALLLEKGGATGTLPGTMTVHLDVGATFTGSFTIATKNGSIYGHGTATPHGSGTYESFAGSLTVTGGTGRYRHAHGRAGLYGTFNRGSYALVIQTTGDLSY
jgi:hypothetical protein